MADDKELMNLEEDETEIISLENEDGKVEDYEVLAVIEYNGKEFIVLLPVEGSEEGGTVEILEITSYDEATGLEEYALVDSEETLNAVYDIFKEEFKEYFNFED